MRVEYDNNPNNVIVNKNASNICFSISFKVKFLIRTKAKLNSIDLILNKKRFKSTTTVAEKSEKIGNNEAFPISFIKDINDNKVYLLNIEFDEKNEEDNNCLEIKLMFDYNGESESVSSYIIEWQKPKTGNTDFLSFQKIYGYKKYISIVFLFLSFILVFYWNTLNSDIINQYRFLSYEYVNIALLFSMLYLGINISSLKVLLYSLTKTVHLIKNIEFYIEPLTLRIINNIFANVVLFILFTIISSTIYFLWPLKFQEKEEISYYDESKKIHEKYFYRKDINDIKVGVNNKYVYKNDDVINIGRLEANMFPLTSTKVIFFKFKYSGICGCQKTTLNEFLPIEKIIQREFHGKDSIIFDRICGKQNSIEYDEEQKSFCLDRKVGGQSISIYDSVDVEFVISTLNEFNYQNFEIIQDLWKKIDYGKLDNEYLIDVSANLNEYFKPRLPGDDDIMKCYSYIVNIVNKGDKNQPFFDDKPKYTFDKLLQLLAIFTGAESYIENVNEERLMSDFKKYLTRPRTNKSSGFIALRGSVTELYLHFLCYIQSLNGKNKNNNAIISRLNDVIDISKQIEISLPSNMKSKEKDARNLFVKNLYVEFARYKYPLDQNAKNFFDKYKDVLRSDLNLIENLDNIDKCDDYKKYIK